MERERDALAQQVAERAEQTGRIKNIMASNQSRYFEDWKTKADDTWSVKLSDYQKRAMGALEEKTQGMGLIIGAPEIYKLGELGTKVGRKYAPEKMAFMDNMANRAAQSVERGVQQGFDAARQGVRNAATNISSRLTQGGPRATTTNVVNEFGNQGFMNVGEDELMGGTDFHEFGDAQNRVIRAMRQVETPTQNVAGGVAQDVGEGLRTAETTAQTTEQTTRNVLRTATEGEETAAEVAPEAMPIIAVAGALTAIGTGLFDIFEPHHDHKPTPPKPPPPMQNRYSIASSILPATQASTSGETTMNF